MYTVVGLWCCALEYSLTLCINYTLIKTKQGGEERMVQIMRLHEPSGTSRQGWFKDVSEDKQPLDGKMNESWKVVNNLKEW